MSDTIEEMELSAPNNAPIFDDMEETSSRGEDNFGRSTLLLTYGLVIPSHVECMHGNKLAVSDESVYNGRRVFDFGEQGTCGSLLATTYAFSVQGLVKEDAIVGAGGGGKSDLICVPAEDSDPNEEIDEQEDSLLFLKGGL